MIPFNEYTLVAGLFVFLVAVFLTSYAFVRVVKRTKYVNVPLEKIQPYFSYGSPMKTGYVECCFQVGVKRGKSYLSEIIPLAYFMGSDEGFIIFDVSIDFPVLYTTGEKIVGEEAIEHFLLQKKSALTVKFVSGEYTPGEHGQGGIPTERFF